MPNKHKVAGKQSKTDKKQMRRVKQVGKRDFSTTDQKVYLKSYYDITLWVSTSSETMANFDHPFLTIRNAI